jgi:pimeloyl-ACP methyl ester carboxylesterase
MRLRRGLLAAGSVLLVAATGCSSFADTAAEEAAAAAAADAADATPTEAPVDDIEWTDCTTQIAGLIADQRGADRDLTFECGRTDVPIDYDDPEGDTLPLFLVRATLGEQPDRIGSLLVNPGGPGGSGADAAIGLALTMPEQVLERFQLVGFDPRGVGLSTPVECIPPDVKEEMFATEPRPTTAAEIDAAFELADRVATGCEEQYGEALGIFNTTDTARDMDRLREALGDEKLTYLGYSYGTTLGSTYAELFPDKVRAMVLDGAVDPDADPVADAEGQAAGFEEAYDAFASGCRSFRAGCPMGDDPRAFLEGLLEEAEAEPIPSAEEGEERRATAGVVMTAVVAALYDQESWPQLSQALVAARKGDAAGVFTLADSYTGRLEDGSYSNLFDANYAINCADTAEEEQVPEEEIRALVAEWSEEYPLFGAGSAVSLYNCSVWDAERTPLPERDAEGSAPILVIGTEGDPATPLAGAVDMAEDLESGVLLTWQGEGHTAYPKTDCVTDAVNAYLLEGTAPQDDLTCPA